MRGKVAGSWTSLTRSFAQVHGAKRLGPHIAWESERRLSMTPKKSLKQKSDLKTDARVESELAHHDNAAIALLESPVPEIESIEVAMVQVECVGDESPSHDEIAVLAYSYW